MLVFFCTEGFALRDHLGVQRDDLVATIHDGARELLPDVRTKPPPLLENAGTLVPDARRVVQVFVERLTEPDLSLCTVILDLPIGRRGHDEIDERVAEFRHRAGVRPEQPCGRQMVTRGVILSSLPILGPRCLHAFYEDRLCIDAFLSRLRFHPLPGTIRL